VLQNPIPHQGVMNAQHEVHPAPPQMGQYQNPRPMHPGNPTDHNILLTSEEEILLQTRGHQYGTLPDSTPTMSELAAPAIVRQALMIPCRNSKPNLCIPRIPLRQNVNNPHARTTHNYSLVDDLAQSPAAIYVLEKLVQLSGNIFFPPWGSLTQQTLDSTPLI
jgi:hypothetical protein